MMDFILELHPGTQTIAVLGFCVLIGHLMKLINNFFDE